MKKLFIILTIFLSSVAHSGDRLEGISGSMDSDLGSFLDWFSDDEKDENGEEETVPDSEGQAGVIPGTAGQTRTTPGTAGQTRTTPDTAEQTGTTPDTAEQTGTTAGTAGQTGTTAGTDEQVDISTNSEKECLKTKVYSLDVENPEQYKRLEDYPFTYECVTRR